MSERVGMLIVLALGCAVMAGAAEPTIRFEAERVVIDITPGAEAVYYSVAKERHGQITHRVTRTALLADDDHDGEVEIAMPDGVPLIGVWVAVDLRTGQAVASSPFMESARSSEIIRGPLLGENEPGVVELESALQNPVNLFVARPNVGGWQGYVGDGAEHDTDGATDGVIVADLGAMHPLEPEMGELGTLGTRDIVVAVDSDTMAVSIERVVGNGR